MLSQIHFSSATPEWATPEATYAQLNAEFKFDLDPCPLGGSEDGLAPLFVSWRGRRVFCNPPYGPGIVKWLTRGLEAEVAVFLIPARTDTRWFHELCLTSATEIRFIKGRLKFGGCENPAPFPSMVVIFDQAKRGLRFTELLGTAMRDADEDAEAHLTLLGTAHETAASHSNSTESTK